MSQAGGDHSGSSGPAFLLRQSHSRAHGTGLHRHFWNTSSEGEPPWAICSSACSLLLQQLLFIFTGTSCLSVSAHRLLSYCFTQFGRAWKHPLTPSDSYTHFLYTLMEALLSHLFLDLNRLNFLSLPL